MLRPKSHSDHARRNAAQHRELLEKLERQWKPAHLRFVAQSRMDNALVRENLKPLGHARRKFPALLNLTEPPLADCAGEQRLRQNVRGGNSVLNGEVDADTSYWRHRVSGVADA